MFKTISIPLILQKMAPFFINSGYEAWLVGGAIRDMLSGKDASDFDIATNARPDEVSKLFNHVIETGIEHGTVTVLFMGEHVEVTTFRTESDYSDGRHPDAIQYTASIVEDLSRRDFTINAIALNLESGNIIDPFNGKKDIKKRVIQTVGKAEDRFSEDGLRPIRAIRFASQLNFTIEKNTFSAIKKAIPITKNISIERFRDEFSKMLLSNKPSIALKLMEQTGILEIFLPELLEARDVTQADKRGFHQFDVLDHLFYSCDFARIPAEKDITIRLASLFHDIGKVKTRKIDGEKITFFNHEKESSKTVETVLKKLRFSNNTIRYVSHLVEHHMFHYESTWSDAAVRRFIVRITPPEGLGKTVEQVIEDLFDLRIADVSGMTNSPALLQKGPWSANLIEFKDRIHSALNEPHVFSLKDLKVTGQDLIEIGIPKGKQIGYVLSELLKMTIDDPGMNEREILIDIAKKII